jgi:hypothetical protein
MFNIAPIGNPAAVVQYRWHDFIVSGLRVLAQSEARLLRELPVEGTATWCRSGREDFALLKSAARNSRTPMRNTPQTP